MRDLTNREWQVVGLLARGWSARRIADELGCSSRTIEEHTARIATTIPNPDDLPSAYTGDPLGSGSPAHHREVKQTNHPPAPPRKI